MFPRDISIPIPEQYNQSRVKQTIFFSQIPNVPFATKETRAWGQSRTAIPGSLGSKKLQDSSLFLCDLIFWETFASIFTVSGMKYINP